MTGYQTRKKDNKINAVEGPVVPVNGAKLLNPFPALGRKLLTLIQAAGLNQLELVPEYKSPGLVGSVNRVKEVLDEHTMGNGTQLNKLFGAAPWLSLERINDMLTQLEVSLQTDSSDKEACVYIIGIAIDANREEVTFSVRVMHGHRPEARVSINGESTYNTGSRGPILGNSGIPQR